MIELFAKIVESCPTLDFSIFTFTSASQIRILMRGNFIDAQRTSQTTNSNDYSNVYIHEFAARNDFKIEISLFSIGSHFLVQAHSLFTMPFEHQRNMHLHSIFIYFVSIIYLIYSVKQKNWQKSQFSQFVRNVLTAFSDILFYCTN